MIDANGRIACIGWGSLIWDPDNLPVASGWRQDGPLLPVEFARQSSRDGKISLVICKDTPALPTLWAMLNVADMTGAKQALATREGIENPNARGVGFWGPNLKDSRGQALETIVEWARSRGLCGVVWTSLTCGFEDRRGQKPSEDHVVSYLRSLYGERRVKAEEYVRKAPEQIDTPYRQAIVRELGWSFHPSDA